MNRAIALSLLLLLSPAVALADDEEDPKAAQVAALEEADKAKPPAPGIVFLGSTSINKWNLGASFPGRECLNRGLDGWQLLDLLHYGARLVAPAKPKVVVVHAGDNDLWTTDVSISTVVDDYRRMIDELRRAVPDVKVIFIGIKPSPARWEQIDRLRDVNAGIKAMIAKDPKQRYVDVDRPMLGQDGKPNPELYLENGLHLTPKGYELWTKLLAPVLDELAPAEKKR